MSEEINKLFTEKDLRAILALSMLPLEKKFNIFGLSRISQDELFASDVWAYFLDPNEQHGLKTIFLEALFKKILKDEYSNEFSQKLKNIKVYREIATDHAEEFSAGRIDIEVVGDFGVLVIENKINASTKNNPWQSYYEKAKRNLDSKTGEVYAGFLTKYSLDLKNIGNAEFENLECKTFNLIYKDVLRQVEEMIKKRSDLDAFENRSLELFKQFLEFSEGMRKKMDIQEGMRVLKVFEGDLKVANEKIKVLDEIIDAWLDELMNTIKAGYGDDAEKILGKNWGTSWGTGNTNNELIVGKEPYAHWIFRGNNTFEMKKENGKKFSIEFYYVRSWSEKSSEDTKGAVYYKFWSKKDQEDMDQPEKLADFSEDITEVAAKAISKIDEIRKS